MCESTAYILKNGLEELVLENIDTIEDFGNAIKLRSMFGEEIKIKARFKILSLVDHKIILEPY